jgi:hypothetical protein
MDWTDLTQIEAYARNWLIELGRRVDLPLAGRDWELIALAVAALIALMLWTWPVRRAFRIGGPLRWLVAGLNLASLAFFPLWFLALILSGIRRRIPTPAQPRTASAPAGAVPALLLNALKTLAQTAGQKTAPGKRIGPWGKAAPAQPAPTSRSATPSPSRPATVQRQHVTTATTRRGSALPNRETWVRRR